MAIYVSGSLAFDRIMTFGGNLQDHVLMDKLHMLSVSFMVDSMDERRGGCAGNIAYTLALLGEKPIVVSAAGRDFTGYAAAREKLGWVKDGLFGQVLAEIQAVKAACQGRVLKVIIETCLLTQEEKRRLCQVVSDAGADYIKTSTGFSTGGATAQDVALLRQHTAPQVKVKAAGGIATKEDAEAFLALGADRLGTSRLVKLAKEAGL